MSISEVMTIMVMFEMSHYRTFKDFYYSCLHKHYHQEFPKLFKLLKTYRATPLSSHPILCIGNKYDRGNKLENIM